MNPVNNGNLSQPFSDLSSMFRYGLTPSTESNVVENDLTKPSLEVVRNSTVISETTTQRVTKSIDALMTRSLTRRLFIPTGIIVPGRSSPMTRVPIIPKKSIISLVPTLLAAEFE